MNHCWYKLNIDISNALRSDWKFESQRNDMKQFASSDVFNDSWLQQLKYNNLQIDSTIVHFKQRFFRDVEAHIDTSNNGKKNSCFGFNWVIGGKGSKMIWYNMQENNPGITYTTPAGTPYVAWPIKSLTEIDGCEIQSEPVLIRVDVPHSIIVGDDPRLSISARTNINFMSWSEIVNYLRKKNLLIERD
jgi:hypothetical protein